MEIFLAQAADGASLCLVLNLVQSPDTYSGFAPRANKIAPVKPQLETLRSVCRVESTLEASQKYFNSYKIVGTAPASQAHSFIGAFLKDVAQSPLAADVMDAWVAHTPITRSLKCQKCPNDELALTNCVIVHPSDYLALHGGKTPFVQCKEFVYSMLASELQGVGEAGLGRLARGQLLGTIGAPLEFTTYLPPANQPFHLNLADMEVDFASKPKSSTAPFRAKDIIDAFMFKFRGQVMNRGQQFYLDIGNSALHLTVKSLSALDSADVADVFGSSSATASGSSSASAAVALSSKAPAAAAPAKPTKEGKVALRGLLTEGTKLQLHVASNSSLALEGAGSAGPSILDPNWTFASMGIGGLDEEFATIFRRAFASRVYPPELITRLGVRHVKGILLWGPPGTGKTLIARQIGKMLNGKEPKVVSGPEILSKFVGQTEENLRALFADAEKEQKAKGENSGLHIIVFDEMDALFKARGSTRDGTGVGDSVVNQLLAKMDGTEILNNILCIGMTNRKDMLDEALLRPGRFEVHVEIGLPDEKGRVQIFNIHTKKMRKEGFMDDSISIEELAAQTKNYSGAEICGVVNAALSFAMNRLINIDNLASHIDDSKIHVTQADFQRAILDVHPSFGIEVESFGTAMNCGIVDYGPPFQNLLTASNMLVRLVSTSDKAPLASLLLTGVSGCGKTAIASYLALQSKFPYVKMITPNDLVAMQDQNKAAAITKVFDNAYKSPLSCIVLDDLERLLGYITLGPNFSNTILQTLLVLLKKPPPKGKRLLIICTSGNLTCLRQLELLDLFTNQLTIPMLEEPSHFAKVLQSLETFNDEDLAQCATLFTKPMPLKKLIEIAEMARDGAPKVNWDNFVTVYQLHSI